MNPRHRVAVALALLLLGACRSLPSPPASGGEVLLDVPFHAQQRYQCGPAALASMLGAADLEVTPGELVEEVWLPGRRGALAMELAAAARARGLLVYPVNTGEALLVELEAGHPVLVQQNLLFDWWPRWHFAVVVGYSDDGHRMLMHSGTRRNLATGWRWFHRAWRKGGQMGWVMLRDELPARSQPLALAAAIEDLARVSGEQPLKLWEGASARHPSSALIQFALGNARYQSADVAGALDAWRRAVSLEPDMHRAWNNLAHALAGRGCPASARQALSRALALAPEEALYADTAASIEAGQDSAGCASPDGGTAPSERYRVTRD